MPTANVPPEGVAEGRKVPVDAPPETFHAGMITELDPPIAYGEKGYGPSGPPQEEPEPVEETEAVSDEVASPEGVEGGKEETPTVEAKPKESDHVPKERFNEVNEKAKQFEESHRMLQWILQNPAEFAKMSGKQPAAAAAEAPVDEGYDYLMVKPPEPSKPIDEMEDREVLSFLVAKELHKALGPVFKTLGKDLSSLKGFKTEIQDALVKSAVGPDGKPLYPRWDELKPVMQEVQKKYAGISPQEAYVLADRFSGAQKQTASTPARAETANEQLEQPKPRLAPQPKKPNLAVARANFMSNLGGRSGGALRDNVQVRNIRESVERALADIGFPQEEE